MAYIIGAPEKKPSTTHHIRFHPDDEAKIRAKAEKAGMTVNAYIKSRVLNSRASRKQTQHTSLLVHTEAMDHLVQEIRTFCKSPHQDRWLYEADLERIDRKLTELLQAEMKLVDQLSRR